VKADLRAPRDFGEVLGYSWRIYFSRFPALFVLALIVTPLTMLGTVVLRNVDSLDATYAVLAAFLLPSLLISTIAQAALVVAVHDISAGNPPEPGRAVDLVFERIAGIVTTMIMYVALVIASIFAPLLAIVWLFDRTGTIDGRRTWWLILVPFALMIYMMARWWFYVQAIMIEHRGGFDALDGSADAVRGAWWASFGGMVFLSAFGLGSGAISAMAAGAPAAIEATVAGAVSALALPFMVAAQTLWYYALVARKAPDVSPAQVDAP
jgi:hypothetical protein